MQDMLVPIFGESGAIIAQYVITLAVVVALIVLVVWGLRHFGGGAVRPATRGRLPRLAIVDTLPVDTKRKLVLLRRDNVEHLILIGGPSDVVVEPSIVRQRVAQRPGQGTAARPQAGIVAPDAAPTPDAEHFESYLAEPAPVPTPPPLRTPEREAEAAESAIPFTPRRSSLPASERVAPERPAAERHAPSRREALRGTMQAAPTPASEAPRPYRPYSPAASVAARQVAATSELDPEARPEARSVAMARPMPMPARAETAPSRFAPPPERPVAEEPPDGPVPGYDGDGEQHAAANVFAPPEAQPDDDEDEPAPLADDEADADHGGLAAGSPAEPEPAEGEEAGQSVSELEQEMARLLDQISTSRRE
jgi:hypothetical protein